jgi:hypothetical protein
MQGIQLADLPYFILLAALSIYIGAHRGLTMKIRQQISMREVGRLTTGALAGKIT